MSDNKKQLQGGVIFLTVFLDLVGFSIIFPLFPAMLEYYFGQSGGEWLRSVAGGEGDEALFRAQVLFGGLLGSLYSILQFICAPLWGSYSDRVGRKKVLLITVAGLALSYLLWFFSASFALLIGARFLGGAMGGNISVASAAIADSTDAKNRTRGMAIIGIAFGLGFVCGPVIGGLLSLEALDLTKLIGGESIGVNPFSTPALAAFTLSVVNLIWISKRFKETLPPENRGEVTHRRPINPLKLFRRVEYPGVARANLVYFIFIVMFAGMEFTLTFLAKDALGYSPVQMGFMFLYIGFIIVLVQGGLVRRLAPKIGERKLAMFGLVLLPIGFLLTGWNGSNVLLFYTGLAFLACGSASVTPSMSGLVSLYSPPEHQGEVQGIFRSIGALGRAVGPLAACTVYWKSGPEPLYTAAAVLMLAPILIARALPAPRSQLSGEPEEG